MDVCGAKSHVGRISETATKQAAVQGRDALMCSIHSARPMDGLDIDPWRATADGNQRPDVWGSSTCKIKMLVPANANGAITSPCPV